MLGHIMVINDNRDILELFHELLSEEGYQVTLAAYAINDLEQVRIACPDLIILDYMFGAEASGWQFLQKLKMSRDLRHIPIIVCTAALRQVSELKQQLDNLGIKILPKPFDIEQLLAAVREQMAEPEIGKAKED